MVRLGLSTGVCCSTSSLGFFDLTFHQRRRISFLFARNKENVLSGFVLDPRLSIWNTAYQVYLLKVSLLQWNLTELITYLKVLPFHSYVSNEFFPMTSLFLSIALSLILSHSLYLTGLLQDTVKCVEVVLFKGYRTTLNSFNSCWEQCWSTAVPSTGWSGAELMGSVVDGFWSYLCYWGSSTEFCLWYPRSVFLIPGTEFFPWAAITAAVFVYFLLKENRTKKYLAVTISGTFNLLNPQNILQNINS